MTSPVSHSAALQLERVREGSVVLPHAAGKEPTMSWHRFTVGGGTSSLGPGMEEWAQKKFTELGGRRAVGLRQALLCIPEMELKLSVSAHPAGTVNALQK